MEYKKNDNKPCGLCWKIQAFWYSGNIQKTWSKTNTPTPGWIRFMLKEFVEKIGIPGAWLSRLASLWRSPVNERLSFFSITVARGRGLLELQWIAFFVLSTNRPREAFLLELLEDKPLRPLVEGAGRSMLRPLLRPYPSWKDNSEDEARGWPNQGRSNRLDNVSFLVVVGKLKGLKTPLLEKERTLGQEDKVASFKELPALATSALGFLPCGCAWRAREPGDVDREDIVCNKESEGAPFTQPVLYKELDIKGLQILQATTLKQIQALKLRIPHLGNECPPLFSKPPLLWQPPKTTDQLSLTRITSVRECTLSRVLWNTQISPKS